MSLTKVSYSMIDGASVNVLDYGAVGDGVVDDSAAFAAAFAAGTCIYLPNKTFFLGTVTNANSHLIELANINGLSIVSDNATITATIGSLDTSSHSIFHFDDCSNISVIGTLNFELTGTFVQSGPDAFLIDSNSATSENFYFQDIRATNVAAVIRANTGSQAAPFSNRVQNITIDSLTATDCYYGYLSSQNGDNVNILSLTATNTIRSFFVFGVDNVQANVKSYDHPQSSADILITTFYRNTTNIKVRYIPTGNLSTEYLVAVQHVKTTAPNNVNGPASGKVIENIYIYFDDSDSNGGNLSITLREVDTVGSVSSTSPHIMQNVKIEGKTVRFNGNSPDAIVNTPTSFAEPGRLYIDNSFFDYYAAAVSNVSQPFSLFEWLQQNPIANWQISMGRNRWARNIIGNLETQTLEWDMQEVYSQSCGVKVSLMINQDITATAGGGGMAVKYLEYAVFGSVSSASLFTYLSAALLSSGAAGGYNPTITFSGVGSTKYLTCTLTSANGGTPANGRAVGIIEFI